MKESFIKKLVRSRLKWAGYVERMTEEKLAESKCSESGEKREARKTENAMRCDCVKRGLGRVGEEGRTTAKDRRS